MKNTTTPTTNNTIFRNNYIISGIRNRSFYGCEITRKGDSETHTILWVTTEKVCRMSNDEFNEMLKRHGVA